MSHFFFFVTSKHSYQFLTKTAQYIKLKRSLSSFSMQLFYIHNLDFHLLNIQNSFFFCRYCFYLSGIVQLFKDTVPQLLFQFVTSFSNIGGILNGIVYLIMKRGGATGKKFGGCSTLKSSTADVELSTEKHSSVICTTSASQMDAGGPRRTQNHVKTNGGECIQTSTLPQFFDIRFCTSCSEYESFLMPC